MILDLYPTHLRDIDFGNFPLTHDCILKVEYIQGSPIIFQYFTCKSTDSARIADIFLKCSLVHKVNISSVDELSNKW